ncbi:GntR family transcriptional regulator [Nocardia sp. NBC_01329]|uniref:GntR family transcriptional regulator n=1 Tax=Nocardia sp. NBC_01329 TaxID=2903594 RepID=UPI002E0DB68E
MRSSIVEHMGDALLAERWAEGDRLPSIAVLSCEHSVSKTTMSHALRLMREDGLLLSLRGIGYCVAPGAAARVRNTRRRLLVPKYVTPLLNEKRWIGISDGELELMLGVRTY